MTAFNRNYISRNKNKHKDEKQKYNFNRTTYPAILLPFLHHNHLRHMSASSYNCWTGNCNGKARRLVDSCDYSADAIQRCFDPRYTYESRFSTREVQPLEYKNYLRGRRIRFSSGNAIGPQSSVAIV